MLSVDSIAKITGCPANNVATVWPVVVGALKKAGIDSPLVEVAAIATIAVETPSFYPLAEESPRGMDRNAYFKKMYFDNAMVAHRLGNQTVDDAIRFYGRGLIQLTGRDNYELYSELLDLPLCEHPDLCLDPAVSSRIFAEFFERAGIDVVAQTKDWHRVRIRVNGGTNGWTRFISVVNACLAQV